MSRSRPGYPGGCWDGPDPAVSGVIRRVVPAWVLARGNGGSARSLDPAHSPPIETGSRSAGPGSRFRGPDAEMSTPKRNAGLRESDSGPKRAEGNHLFAPKENWQVPWAASNAGQRASQRPGDQPFAGRLAANAKARSSQHRAPHRRRPRRPAGGPSSSSPCPASARTCPRPASRGATSRSASASRTTHDSSNSPVAKLPPTNMRGIPEHLPPLRRRVTRRHLVEAGDELGRGLRERRHGDDLRGGYSIPGRIRPVGTTSIHWPAKRCAPGSRFHGLPRWGSRSMNWRPTAATEIAVPGLGLGPQTSSPYG